MEVYSIGFMQSTAARFFGRLNDAGIRRLLDVRLNNTSQLTGFAKRGDLAYFLKELCGAEYAHEPLLAPTQEMLDGYKKQGGSWPEYERSFLALLSERRVETELTPSQFAIPTVLLCSEATPERCHRRIALEYLRSHWPDVEIVHL